MDLTRRQFLTGSLALAAASAMPRLGASQLHASMNEVFTQQPLPYAFDALEPHIDAKTMQIHFSRHHAGYIRKLKAALQDMATPSSVEDLISDLGQLPAEIRTAVRNNGGGAVNHALFWQVMTPGGSEPRDKAFLQAVLSAFGSLGEMQEGFTRNALGVFGSGWSWLCVDTEGRLSLMKTANQDNPIMRGIVDQPATPILGLDVWEHAYYLKYQNRRADYVKAWWQVVNWPEVERRFHLALA